MSLRTPQCEVFWAFLLNSEHSGVSEDSKSPTLGVLGFTPTLGQSGVVTLQQHKESALTHKEGIFVLDAQSTLFVPQTTRIGSVAMGN